MIVRIEDLKKICEIISKAMDVSKNDIITSTLELKAEGGYLNVIVSNHEYYVNAHVDIHEDVDFSATVIASKFLALISKTTSDTVKFEVEGNSLIVTGNGRYPFPMVFDTDGKMLEIPEISLGEVTQEFSIGSDILSSILKYNTKEIARRNPSEISNPLQELYYIDDEGCITFTLGACVNRFHLDKPVKILLSQKVVRLFDLFKNESADFSLGHNLLSNGTMQTVIKLENKNVSIIAILPPDNITKVPADAIRSRAFADYKYSVNINRTPLFGAIERLLIVHPDNQDPKKKKRIAKLSFSDEFVTISTMDDMCTEKVYYDGSKALSIAGSYDAVMDLLDLKTAVERCDEQFVTFNFGDMQAFSVARGNIFSVIPEIR